MKNPLNFRLHFDLYLKDLRDIYSDNRIVGGTVAVAVAPFECRSKFILPLLKSHFCSIKHQLY